MIPASIPTGIKTLLAGVNASYPLAAATVTALADLQQQANGLIDSIDATLAADSLKIVAPEFVQALTFAAAITALVSVAKEEAALAELAGLTGRAAINIANSGV